LDPLVGPDPLQRTLASGKGRRQIAALQGERYQRADGNGKAGFQMEALSISTEALSKTIRSLRSPDFASLDLE
jgi:hypothetical protein